MKNLVKKLSKGILLFVLTIFINQGCATKIEKVINLNERGLRCNKLTNELLDDKVYDSGVYSLNKDEEFVIFDIKQKQVLLSDVAFTKDKIKIGYDIVYRYKPNQSELCKLYKQFGLKYDKHVIKPELIDVIREVVSMHNVNEITQGNYLEFEKIIYNKIELILKQKFIVITYFEMKNMYLFPK